jgi:ubiquinone biosynthesis UbiH/UbiF/VisC/COQ6 family hydroxylase
VRHDLIVVGGGPVGAVLARAASASLSVALVGEPPRLAAPSAGEFDARVYALSPANVAFLRDLGAWDALQSERITPVHAMSIFGDDARSRLGFDALEAGVPELAWIVEDGALQRALWQALGRVEVIGGAACERLVVDAERASLFFADGRRIDARLVAGADGAQSFVRHAAGIGARESDYGQAALVGNFRAARPHANTARQWFQDGAVLALLPLPQGQVSMVWSLPADEAERLAGVPPAVLAAAVAKLRAACSGSSRQPPRCAAIGCGASRRTASPRPASRSPETPRMSSIRSPGRG